MPPLRDLVGALLTPYVVARNWVDYPLRRWLLFPRPVRGVEPAGLENALAELDPSARVEARRLVERYDLGGFAARARRRDLLVNLYYLEMLERALAEGGAALPDERVAAVDVGPSDWFYAPALAGLLRRWGRPPGAADRQLSVLGFEADPGRRYADGHTRADWAAWYAGGLEGFEYRTDDARAWRGEADLALMLFPFLFTRDLDRWGLPRRLFAPEALLAHVWSHLRPGGTLVLANQGARERDEQRRLCARLGIELAWSERFESRFWRYELERWVHVAGKR